jgi:hypothetical protein
MPKFSKSRGPIVAPGLTQQDYINCRQHTDGCTCFRIPGDSAIDLCRTNVADRETGELCTHIPKLSNKYFAGGIVAPRGVCPEGTSCPEVVEQT